MQSPSPKDLQTGRRVGFKYLKALQGLAVAQLILAVIIIVSLIAAIVIAVVSPALYTAPFLAILGFLFGLSGVVGGGLGMGAFRSRGHRQRCLLVGHFVMSIITTVLGFFTFLMTIVNVIAINNTIEYFRHSPYLAAIKAVLAAVCFTMMATLVHVITSILSAAFTCSNWCGRSVDDSSVAFVPHPDSDGTISLGTRSVEKMTSGGKAQDVV